MGDHPSWEDMAIQVLAEGRPGDIWSAALGWENVINGLKDVEESLKTNVKDLEDVWRGSAYDAFKEHIEGIAKSIKDVVEDLEKNDGVVGSLNNAADKLAAAQADMPIPYAAVDDIARARDARVSIPITPFWGQIEADYGGFVGMAADFVGGIMDWFNDQEDEAAQVYERVSGEYHEQYRQMPGQAQTTPVSTQDPTDVDPQGPPGGTGPGSIPETASMPTTDTPAYTPADTTMPAYEPPGTTAGPGATTPSYGGAGGGSGGSTPDYGGLQSGGGSGLNTGGGGGGGLGAGGFGGGGSLGKPVSPGAGLGAGMMGMGGMGAGGRGGAGKGGGRGAGLLGAGGRGGAHGNENEEHGTWLKEEDDVWGTDEGDAPPSLLR